MPVWSSFAGIICGVGTSIKKSWCARCLQMLGAHIDGPEQREFNGLQVDLWPRVSWSPSFAICFADLEVPGIPPC